MTGPESLLQGQYDAEAQVDHMAQEIQRLTDQIRALCSPAETTLTRALVQDPFDESFHHIISGSYHGLTLVINAHRDLKACHIALGVAGREMAAQKERADHLQARVGFLLADIEVIQRQMEALSRRATAAEDQLRDQAS